MKKSFLFFGAAFFLAASPLNSHPLARHLARSFPGRFTPVMPHRVFSGISPQAYDPKEIRTTETTRFLEWYKPFTVASGRPAVWPIEMDFTVKFLGETIGSGNLKKIINDPEVYEVVYSFMHALWDKERSEKWKIKVPQHPHRQENAILRMFGTQFADAILDDESVRRAMARFLALSWLAPEADGKYGHLAKDFALESLEELYTPWFETRKPEEILKDLMKKFSQN